MKRVCVVIICILCLQFPSHIAAQKGSTLIITTIAGTGTSGFSGDGGPAAQAHLNYPTDVAVDAKGNVYVADAENHRIRRVSTDGIITTFAGTGTPGFAGDGGPATQAHLNYPTGVAVDATGVIYIADFRNHRIRRVGVDGIITTIAGDETEGFAGDGGLATQASLNLPNDVAVDTNGAVYIVDSENHRIRRVGVDGIITTIAGSGTPRFAGDGGPATQANLHYPGGVAVDAKGMVYIADSGNHRIRRVGVDGIITTFAGTGIGGFAGDGGQAAQAKLGLPQGVVVEAKGMVYIADSGNHRIRRVGVDGIITTIAGNGTPGFAGDGGPATQASLHRPFSVVLDSSKAVYVAEPENHRIRRLNR